MRRRWRRRIITIMGNGSRAKLRDFILSANVSERGREWAVRCWGSLNDKDTAQFLVQTVLKGRDRNITQRLSDAAADGAGGHDGFV